MTNRPEEFTSIQTCRARVRLRRTVDDLLRGSGLEIRELATSLAISNPRDPDRGRIYITYTAGEVSRQCTTWEFLGPLRGYEGDDDPDREPPVNAATIITALTGQEPPPAA